MQLQRPDIRVPLYQSFDGAVHAVHQPAFGVEQDGIGGVCRLDQLQVLGNRAGCGLVARLAEPVALIQLGNLRQRNPARLYLLLGGQSDELAHIPGQQPLRAGAKVVLGA